MSYGKHAVGDEFVYVATIGGMRIKVTWSVNEAYALREALRLYLEELEGRRRIIPEDDA